MPLDYGALGVAGLVAATLAYILAKVWTAYLAKDKAYTDCQESHITTYTTLLVSLTGTLDGLKRAIEERWREDPNAPRH